jgi:hypothetical protein
MNNNTVLIVAGDHHDAARYATFLEDDEPDPGFLAVATIEEALAFCEQITPDCIVVDDSVEIQDLLISLTVQGGILSCPVVTIVRQPNSLLSTSLPELTRALSATEYKP